MLIFKLDRMNTKADDGEYYQCHIVVAFDEKSARESVPCSHECSTNGALFPWQQASRGREHRCFWQSADAKKVNVRVVGIAMGGIEPGVLASQFVD